MGGFIQRSTRCVHRKLSSAHTDSKSTLPWCPSLSDCHAHAFWAAGKSNWLILHTTCHCLSHRAQNALSEAFSRSIISRTFCRCCCMMERLFDLSAGASLEKTLNWHFRYATGSSPVPSPVFYPWRSCISSLLRPLRRRHIRRCCSPCLLFEDRIAHSSQVWQACLVSPAVALADSPTRAQCAW